MEVEMKDKKITELNQLIKELKQYNPLPADNQLSKTSEIKQLKDEVSRLNQINKNRNNILEEMDTKTQNLRETETKLKLSQNDIEILVQKNKSYVTSTKELTEKNEDLEQKVSSMKDQLYKV
jgi:chromosome segregation ATPase